MMPHPHDFDELMKMMVIFHRAWVIKEDHAVPVRVVSFGGDTVSELELLVQFADGSQLFISASDVWGRHNTLVVPYPEQEFLKQHQESMQDMIKQFVQDTGRPWKDYMNEPTTLSKKPHGDGGVGKPQRIPVVVSESRGAGSSFASGSVSRNAEIEALEAAHAAATKILEAVQADATKTLEAGHEDATKTLKAVHEASTKTLEVGHAAAITTLKVQHAADLLPLQSKCVEIKSLEEGHATAIKTLKDLHEDVVSNLEAKYVNIKTELKDLQEKMKKEHASERLRKIHHAVETGARVRHQTESFCSLPGRAGVPPPKERRDGTEGESSTKHPRL